MRLRHVLAVVILFTLVGANHAYATNERISLQYDKPYKTSTAGVMYYDLSKIGLKITNVHILIVDDTPSYETDDASLVKITINVINNGLDHFVVQDKMFELWVLEKNKNDMDGLDVVDNYDTTYDDEFEVRYEKMNSRELYNECDQTIENIDINESLDFTLCYDILKSRNKGEVNLDDSRKYVLVMMDNSQSTSCPNCKKITLQNDPEPRTQIMPKWVSKLIDWKSRHLISEGEFQQSFGYLIDKGIIKADYGKPAYSIAEKWMELAAYEHILSKAYGRNLFVSAIQIVESKDSDGFTGIICKKQNNIITLDADYTNDDAKYKVVFFRLKVFDDSGSVAIDGLSKIVNVAPKSFRHVSISVPAVQNPSHCTVGVDAKFS